MPLKAVELYQQYVKAWAAILDQECRQILNAVLDTEILYRVSRTEGTGHQIVIDDMQGFQTQFPGGQFALRSVSEHHDVALMEWQLLLPDGTPDVRGHDAVCVTTAGKLGEIVTFAPSTTLEPSAA